jgi:hypothetical protein
MRLRFTVRTLVVIVAIIGLAMAVVTMVRRSSEFREIAEEQADSEQMSMAYADEGRGKNGDGQRVARGEQMAAYRALRIKYERAARYPWLPVEPDPPEPDPPP